MPRARWPLHAGCPRIQVTLTRTSDAAHVVRDLLADTGAGTDRAGFDLLLAEQDCLDCGGLRVRHVVLGGAYSGSFPVYLVRVQVPGLTFDRRVPAVGVRHCPAGFGGLACFRFLNRFTYGNFADAGGFGLEL
jgi:hypothetical protein